MYSTYFPRDRKISQMESFAGQEEMLITFSVFHSSVSRIKWRTENIRGETFFFLTTRRKSILAQKKGGNLQ